jgi:hypothetical protein
MTDKPGICMGPETLIGLLDHTKKSAKKPTKLKKCGDDGCDGGNGSDAQLVFHANLSFQQELVQLLGQPNQFTPASETTNRDAITGTLSLTFARDLSSANYQLSVLGATRPDNKVTAAHLHYGRSNVNGPVLVTLFSNPTGVNSDGLLSQGVIRNSDITHFNGGGNADNQVNSVGSLFAAARNGAVYANVHTQLLPDGAARGQVLAGTLATDNDDH